MNPNKKNKRLIEVIVSVIMSVAMGMASTIIVCLNPNANTPPFILFCLLNVTESIITGVCVALFVPLGRLSDALVRKLKLKNPSLEYNLVYSIPLAIGNGLIVSAVVSFINIAIAYTRLDPTQCPPLLVMWASSWIPLIIPLNIISYIFSVIVYPMVSSHFSANARESGTGKKLRNFQLEMLLVFAVIIAGVTIVVDLIVVDRSKTALQNKVSELITVNSRQIELNIDSYLDRMETTPTLLYSDDIYYKYDATDEKISEYDKVKTEEAITDRIVDIGLMNNYNDFGIIYADNHKVGWISQSTQNLFENTNLYDSFADCLLDSSQSSWLFGINGSSDRFYYIKRLNPNAILVSSVYTDELSSVFIYPKQIDGMDIRLVDGNNTVIYSSKQEESGTQLPEEIAAALTGSATESGDSSVIIGSEYLINANVCTNGWRVICTVPTSVVTKEAEDLKSFTMRISALMALIFVLAGLLMIRRVSLPMDDLLMSLQYKAEVDRLSGTMNKTTFQETVEKKLAHCEPGIRRAFVMIDMDNFKLINDKNGHSYGDQVIIRFGKLIRSLYDNETIIGRLGGDEFAIYIEAADTPEPDNEDFRQAVTSGLDRIMTGFKNEFKEEQTDCNISVSMGVYLNCDNVPTFNTMYVKADKALYQSKENGKNRYTLYEEGDENA
ncbi:MAG: sensor domain-containing diguanylate cyclase [Lachnospiraceae bacterium]|nr:sensor domain-containing diguanylate cyclase [Lachnospiraceae bacterium]